MEPTLRAVIGELLGQLEHGETPDLEKLARVRAALEGASHDGECPCGSGKTFAQCCKLDWLVLRDRGKEGVAQAPVDSPKEEKGNGEDKDSATQGAQWICRVGIMENGNIAVEPQPQGVNTPPIRIAELLLSAYHMVNFNATIATMQAINRKSVRPNGPTLRSAFGN